MLATSCKEFTLIWDINIFSVMRLKALLANETSLQDDMVEATCGGDVFNMFHHRTPHSIVKDQGVANRAK
jgi:hypothetical protein